MLDGKKCWQAKAASPAAKRVREANKDGLGRDNNLD